MELSGSFQDVFYGIGIQGKVSIWVFGGLVIPLGCPGVLLRQYEGMSRGSEKFPLNQILTRLQGGNLACDMHT